MAPGKQAFKAPIKRLRSSSNPVNWVDGQAFRDDPLIGSVPKKGFSKTSSRSRTASDASIKSVGDASDFVASRWLDLLFVLCGCSVFASIEGFIIQTSLFDHCFGLGVNFYPVACGLAFVPGVFVTMAQNAYDIENDRKYGTRRAHMFRLIAVGVLSILLIFVYFTIVTVYPHLRSSMALISPFLILLGAFASITWGSLAQITSCLPGRFQIYCFIGSMCPFGLYLPANIMLGALCGPVTNTSTTPAASFLLQQQQQQEQQQEQLSHGSYEAFGPQASSNGNGIAAQVGMEQQQQRLDNVVGPTILLSKLISSPYYSQPPLQQQPLGGNGTQYETHWGDVEVFFGLCCILTAGGTLAIVTAMSSAAVRRRLLKRDVSLRRESAALIGTINEDTTIEEERLLSTKDVNSGSSAQRARGGTGDGGGGGGSSGGGSTAAGGTGLEGLLEAPPNESAMSGAAIWIQIWPQALSQFLVTSTSQLVVSQYVNIQARYYTSQTTLLLYIYYIATALGMTAALSKRPHFGGAALLVMSCIRAVVFPLALLYISYPTVLDGLGMQGADLMVCAINAVFCFTNGHLFSKTYSQAQAKFKSPAGASRASSTLSVCYYGGISVAIGVSILVNYAMCDGDPRAACGHRHHHANSTRAALSILDSTGGGGSSISHVGGYAPISSGGRGYYYYDTSAHVVPFSGEL